MDEKFDLLRKYNLWDNNRIETGYERSLYTERIADYLGNRLVKVLTGGSQGEIGKKIPTQSINQGRVMRRLLFARVTSLLLLPSKVQRFLYDHF